MRYSVCVIDNDIPASGTQAEEFGIIDSALLNTSNLQLLLKRANWDDEIIKDLIQRLIAEKEANGISAKWEVYGCTHPSFYINAINEGFFRSDVIVFDWDYPGAQNAAETNSESTLHEILKRTFCLVFIFSKADKKDEIEAILAKPEFQQFKERLSYLDKAVPGQDQTGILLQKADEMYEQNFSFKFAGVLRRRSTQCADQILADMGRASLNDVKNLVVVGDGGKKDFIDFLAERFRTSIAGPTIYDLVEKIPEDAVTTQIDTAMVSSVWSYRLYFQQETGDDLVRRGDIVALGAEVLLVLSADCDLLRFWNKNFGIINAVTLHELDQSNSSLKELLEVCVKLNQKQTIRSLLGKVGEPEGPFVLPFVPNHGVLRHYVAIPKDLTSRRISTPEGWKDFSERAKKDHPMKYDYWPGAERLCTMSEPFLTPVVQHIFNTLGGYGVPDYPEQMTTILKGVLKDFSSVPTAASPPTTTVAASVAGLPVEPSSMSVPNVAAQNETPEPGPAAEITPEPQLPAAPAESPVVEASATTPAEPGIGEPAVPGSDAAASEPVA